MGLPWVRLDTTFPMNHKVMTLVEDKAWRAISVYAFGLSLAGQQDQGGFLTTSSLQFIHGTKKEAEQLVMVGLWMPRSGGWDINGWKEFQPVNGEAEIRSNKARKAAEARWAKHKQAAQA